MGLSLPRRFVERMLAGHAGLGVTTVALLYILCLTGTLMVFHQEIVRWEQPGIAEFTAGQPINANKAARAALARADEAHPHELTLVLPTEGMPRMAAYVGHDGWYVDAEGELTEPVSQPWLHFLEGLHFYLTLPSTWGLILVGSLGALMTALVISGLLAHPRMFRDAFRLRLGGKRLVRQTDSHNRIGLWATPFHLLIATTGAALGLCVGIAAISERLGGNEADADFFAPIFGAEPSASEILAPLPDIDGALDALHAERPPLQPWTVNLHHPGTQGQETKILAKHPDRAIFGDYYHFDRTGALTYNTGLSDGAVGQQVFASLYSLHFGSFGGLPVKLAYGMLGILACVLVATGGNIWLIKRRQHKSAHPALERAWVAVVWGTPAVLGLSLLAGVGLAAAPGTLTWLFWIGLAVSLGASLSLSGADWRRYYRLMTALSLMATVVIHLAKHGPGLAGHAIGVSAVLAATAALLAWLEWRRPQPTPAPDDAQAAVD